MRRSTDLLSAILALILLCVPGAARAETPDTAFGASIFNGTAEVLDDPSAARMVKRTPCKSCHAPDGLGREEGRAPPIDGPSLSRPTAGRHSYDEASFIAAVRTGTSASGRVLNRLMPRYALSDAEAAALFDYLAELPAIQRTGVTADTIALGMPAAHFAPHSTYAAAFVDALTRRLGGDSVHGRRVTLVPASAETPPGSLPVLAAVSLPGKWVAPFVEVGVPVLFPFGQLAGDEDPDLIRDFIPSALDERRSLANRLARSTQGPVAIYPAGAAEEELRKALRVAQIELSAEMNAATREVVVLNPGDIGTAISKAPNARVWTRWETLGSDVDIVGRAAVLYTPLGILIDHPEGSALETHARLAGTLMADALLGARRDLTRASLMQGLADAYLKDFGLDYSANPLTGKNEIRFDEFSGRTAGD